MLEIALSVLKVAWPFVLAVAIYGWQEVRVLALDAQLFTSHKRETVLQSNLDAAHQRATDLALLYSGMLPKVAAAAKAQEEKDNVQIASLQQRVDTLSHAPTLHFSGLAVGMLDDLSTFANGGNAGAAPVPVAGAVAVPAVPEVVYSEADIVEHDKLAAEAYRDAVNDFHECRNLYQSARSAQLQVNKP